MKNQSKAYKRLGIVGAAAVVGLVPIGAFAGTASAATAPSSGVGFAVSSTATTGLGTSAIDTLTFLSSGVDSAGTTGSTTIAIAAESSNTGAQTLPTTLTPGSNIILYVGGTVLATSDYSATGTATSATITLLSGTIASGATVEVQIDATNTTSGEVGYDITDGLANAEYKTNQVMLGTAATSTTPTVTGINPLAYNSAGGGPFTITGTFSDYSTAAPEYPVVDFVPVGTTVPTTPTTTSSTTPTATTIQGVPIVAAGFSAAELQGDAPVLDASVKYDVVVYNVVSATPPVLTYSAASATTTAAEVSASSTLDFVPESGVRVADSRIGFNLPQGTLTAGQTYAIGESALANTLALPTNLPTTATDISVNVTAVDASGGAGNLQVWAGTSTTAPATSVVNFQPTNATSNTVILPYATGDSIYIKDNGSPVSAVIDLNGYMTAGFTASTATNNRILDTRSGATDVNTAVGGSTGLSTGSTGLTGDTVYQYNLGSALTNIAGGYTAGDIVVLNATVSAPTSVGNLRVFPGPGTGSPATTSQVPDSSVLTYVPGSDASSLLYITPDSKGYIDLYSNSPGTTNVILDVVGYFTPGDGVTTLASPLRLEDSRPAGIASGSTVTVTANDVGTISSGIPATAVGVVGALGDIQASGAGYVNTYPAGTPVNKVTSNINNFPGQTRSTNAVTAISPASGDIGIYSGGSTTNVTFDAEAYLS